MCPLADETFGGSPAKLTSRLGPERTISPCKLVIIGDVVLDRDQMGRAEQLSSEAPVPQVEVHKTESRPGGAALAALLAVRRGQSVTLVTALARDHGAEEIRSVLGRAGVDIVDLGDPGHTPVKTRIRTSERTLMKLNEAPSPGGVISSSLPLEATDALADAAAVVISDYARGMASVPAVREAVSALAGRVPVVWDPHVAGSTPLPGTTVATPNIREARHYASHIGQEGLSGDIERARELLGRWDTRHLVVTRGDAGAVLLQGNATAPLVVPAPWKVHSDALGAGDHFATAMAASLGSGALPSEAVTAATAETAGYLAAGGVRGVLGMAPDQETLADSVARTRACGGVVVATGGCFDLLHSGHVSLLQQARAIGDCLIVCLNSDSSVRSLKGHTRPLVSAQDRAAVLLALECVDHVVTFDELTAENALKSFLPDIFVKGGDYTAESIPEAQAMESWGGQVVVVPYLQDRSTSKIITEAVRRGASTE